MGVCFKQIIFKDQSRCKNSQVRFEQTETEPEIIISSGNVPVSVAMQ